MCECALVDFAKQVCSVIPPIMFAPGDVHPNVVEKYSLHHAKKIEEK